LPPERVRVLEIAFAAVFSAVILVLFFTLISMNGLVLGNDPAVHLEKAQIFLQTGSIPLINLGWTPPLYQILLATFIAFTGAANLEQMIFLVKMSAVVVDWLLFFSVYLLGARFFRKRIGATAAVLLLMVFPMYEVNLWGGYTTVLGLAFMFLLFLYLPLAVKGFGHLAVTFLVAFSLVLSHQLATFVTVLILPPVMLYMLVKSRGKYLKALIALILGGGVAFFLYYFQAMIPYLGVLLEHVFSTQKTTLYQVPATSLNSFMVNFGFVFFIGWAGLFVAFFSLRGRKQPILYLILFLSFVVPFVLAESYLFGLFLPFQWFIYYLMPSMAILAAVFVIFAFNYVSRFYLKHRNGLRKNWLKVMTVILVGLTASTLVFRFGTVYEKILEGSVFYSTSDLKALDAGEWLRNTYPGNATVVVTYVPGFWFRLFSGKEVIAATNPIIQRNEISESVLDLSYELERLFTLTRAYEAKGGISDEDYVSINHIWNRVSFSSGDGAFISYRQNGVDKKTELSSLGKEIVFEDEGFPKKLEIRYFNDELSITKTILVQNDSYPANVAWKLTPLNSDISNVSLYMSIFFDLQFSFLKAYVPGVLNWENPWVNPSDSIEGYWAVANFSSSTLTDNSLGFYDEAAKVTYALKFEELPDWGNVGALASMQIDAVRFQYNFDHINVGETASFAYNVLTFSETDSKTDFPNLKQLNDVKALFELKPSGPFAVSSRDYRDYIRENKIGFIVYDKNQLDTKIVRCRLLELVYSNDRYAIFRVKNTPQ
jgi:hypothetical protein